MAMTIEWEWMTDDLRWKPYTAACSAAIEAAYNAGESSVNLCIQSTSGFTHSITFKAQPPVQVRKTPFPLSLSSCLVYLDAADFREIKHWGVKESAKKCSIVLAAS
jgi:hypothetical protein